MESKDPAYHYFDDIIKDIDINFSDILLDEKLYENISFYNISYKASTCPKPLRIRFDKIDGFIRVRGGEFRSLVLFDYGLFDTICDKIKYSISEKVVFQIVLIIAWKNQNCFIYSFPIEKILTFHNVIILIKSVVNKKKNFYYNIFLEKGLCKDKSNTRYF